jgi:hypothetical protein
LKCFFAVLRILTRQIRKNEKVRCSWVFLMSQQSLFRSLQDQETLKELQCLGTSHRQRSKTDDCNLQISNFSGVKFKFSFLSASLPCIIIHPFYPSLHASKQSSAQTRQSLPVTYYSVY